MDLGLCAAILFLLYFFVVNGDLKRRGVLVWLNYASFAHDFLVSSLPLQKLEENDTNLTYVISW